MSPRTMRLAGTLGISLLLLAVLLYTSTAIAAYTYSPSQGKVNIITVEDYGNYAIVKLDPTIAKKFYDNIYIVRVERSPALYYGFASYNAGLPDGLVSHIETVNQESTGGNGIISQLQTMYSIDVEMLQVMDNGLAKLYVIGSISPADAENIYNTMKKAFPGISKLAIIEEPEAYETALQDVQALARAYDTGLLDGEGYTVVGIGYSNEVRMPIIAIVTSDGRVPDGLLKTIDENTRGPVLLEVGADYQNNPHLTTSSEPHATAGHTSGFPLLIVAVVLPTAALVIFIGSKRLGYLK